MPTQPLTQGPMPPPGPAPLPPAPPPLSVEKDIGTMPSQTFLNRFTQNMTGVYIYAGEPRVQFTAF